MIWRGESPIAGSAEGIAGCAIAGMRVVFITNNSSIPIAGYVEKLRAFGVPADPDDVCTSAPGRGRAALRRSWRRVRRCSRARAEGVVEALAERGLRVVDAGPVDAVVVGFHRDFDFDRLDPRRRRGPRSALFVATNLDPTYPIAGGFVPGTGALVGRGRHRRGRAPEVAGKPAPPMADLVRARFGPRRLMIGDRPSTDGAFALALGWPFALVLSGRRRAPTARSRVPDPPPPFVADDLARLVPLIRRSLRPSPRLDRLTVPRPRCNEKRNRCRQSPTGNECSRPASSSRSCAARRPAAWPPIWSPRVNSPGTSWARRSTSWSRSAAAAARSCARS